MKKLLLALLLLPISTVTLAQDEETKEILANRAPSNHIPAAYYPAVVLDPINGSTPGLCFLVGDDFNQDIGFCVTIKEVTEAIAASQRAAAAYDKGQSL